MKKSPLIQTISLCFSILFLSFATLYAQSQKEFKTYEGHKQQFLIDIPEGWSAYEQMAAITGPSPTGMVIFSEENIANMAFGQQLDAMARMDTGGMPSFFVDRHPKNKKMSCDHFEKGEIKSVTKMIERDSMFDRDRKVISPLTATPISFGGCKGIRLKGETEKQDGTDRWVVDVYAASDGEFLYLFSLRNIKGNYEKNLSVYEKAMSTLKLTSVVNLSDWPLRPTSTKIRNPGTITLPRTFDKVWYRPGAKAFTVIASSASGSLVITERNIEFRAKKKKDSFDIPIRNITGVHWGMLRGDWANDWAFLVYEIDGIAKTAGFKDGHHLGGGKDADMIFSTIKYAVEAIAQAAPSKRISSAPPAASDLGD